MIEVEITNFQSITHAEFRIEGFTAMVGRSNIGKSAVVRAIKCALTAASGTDFVRHGDACERRIKGNKKCRCQSTVRLKTTALELIWEKGDSVNQYTVTQGGETVEYTAIGSGTPDFLKPEFNPIKVGSKESLLQVHEQFSQPFLLDESGPTVADVLSDVARLDNTNVAIRLANKDRKEAVTTRKVREKDLVKIETALEGYAGLDAKTKLVRAVETQHKGLQAAQERLQWLQTHQDDLEALSAQVSLLRAATKPELPDGEALTTKGSAATQVGGFVDEIEERAPVIRRLMGIEKVELPEVEATAAKGEKLIRVANWVDRLVAFKTQMAHWKKLDAIEVPEAAPTSQKLRKVHGYLERHEKLAEAEAGLIEQLASAAAELNNVLDEFEELGVCPTCTQRIEADHIHQVST